MEDELQDRFSLLEEKMLEMQKNYEKELQSKDLRIDDLLSVVCIFVHVVPYLLVLLHLKCTTYVYT